jgi:outer membrane protein TolC
VAAGCATIQPTPAGSANPPPPLPAAAAGVERQDRPPAAAALGDAPLTLQRALALALAHNPELAAGAWEAEAAAARRRQAAAGHWPRLELAAAYRHHWHAERLVPARGRMLRVPLLAGGRVVSAAAAAELEAAAARRQLARSRAELVFNVTSTFYALLGQDRAIAATLQAREALLAHRRKTEELIAARKAARVDRLNIAVRIAELDHGLIVERGQRAVYQRLLASLLGIARVPDAGLQPAGELGTAAAAPDAERVLAAAVARRPDMAALELRIRAQAERVDAARAAYWPVLAAKGTYGARLSSDGKYDDLGFAGLELALPLFDGLATPARVDEQRAALRALRERRRQLELSIRRQVESALIELRSATARAAATEKAIAMARESLRIARAKAALGRGTTMDVLDAQAALLAAETRHCQARVDRHTARALLELAAGGG